MRGENDIESEYVSVLHHKSERMKQVASTAGQTVLDFLKRPVARANINLEEIGQILVPVPKLDIQKKIIAEIEIRRAKALRLREEAEREWQEAKEKFEKALLG